MMNTDLMLSLARDRHNDLIAEAAKSRLVARARRSWRRGGAVRRAAA